MKMTAMEQQVRFSIKRSSQHMMHMLPLRIPVMCVPANCVSCQAGNVLLSQHSGSYSPRPVRQQDTLRNGTDDRYEQHSSHAAAAAATVKAVQPEVGILLKGFI